MPVEVKAEQVIGLALVPVGSGPDGGDRGEMRLVAGDEGLRCRNMEAKRAET